MATRGRVNAAPAMTEREKLEAELMALENPQPQAMTEREALEAELMELEGGAPATAPATAPAPEKEGEAWYEDLGEGLGVSGLKTYYGAKDLFGQMDDEDRATLADWKEDAAESGWGTAGEIIGDIGQFAVPGGAALKAVKGANALKNAGMLAKTLAVMGSEGLVGGGMAALQIPEEGDTRLENAKEGAIGGVIGAGIGAGLGRTMSKLGRGINKTPAAQKMLDAGIDLTPGEAGTSKAITGIENVMEVTPFLARGTKAAKQAAKEGWNKKVLQEAAPDGATITEMGTKGAKQLKDAVNKAYDDVWKGTGPLQRKQVQTMMDNLRKAAPRLGVDDERSLQAAWNDIEKLIADRSKRGFKSADALLRRRIDSAGKGKYDLTEALKKARQDLRKMLSPDKIKAVDAIDKKYPAYLTVRDAVKESLEEDVAGVFTPSRLTKSMKKIGKDKAGTGEATMQGTAEEGMEVLGKKVGGQPLEWFRRIAATLPSPPGMPTAGKLLLGETGLQKGARRLAGTPRAQALRGTLSPGGVGAALSNQ